MITIVLCVYLLSYSLWCKASYWVTDNKLLVQCTVLVVHSAKLIGIQLHVLTVMQVSSTNYLPHFI